MLRMLGHPDAVQPRDPNAIDWGATTGPGTSVPPPGWPNTTAPPNNPPAMMGPSSEGALFQREQQYNQLMQELREQQQLEAQRRLAAQQVQGLQPMQGLQPPQGTQPLQGAPGRQDPFAAMRAGFGAGQPTPPSMQTPAPVPPQRLGIEGLPMSSGPSFGDIATGAVPQLPPYLGGIG